MTNKKYFIILLLLFIGVINIIHISNTVVISTSTLPLKSSAVDSTEAGTIISPSIIKNVDDYFQSYAISENDDVYNRISGKSLGSADIQSLHYLKMIYHDYEGNVRVGEMIVNCSISSKVLAIFKKLYNDNVEINSMNLVDNYWTGSAEATDESSMEANNSSAFNYRLKTSGSSVSKHGEGLAIDINPLENPYHESSTIAPTTADSEFYEETERNNSANTHVIKKSGDGDGAKIYRAFTSAGFTWGGNWNSLKDYMHFEIDGSSSCDNPTSVLSNGTGDTTEKKVASKKILLIAGHGEGYKYCSNANYEYDGISYHECTETRILIDKIAKYFDANGVSYDIANKFLNDSFWSSGTSLGEEARSTCNNPTDGNGCCGYVTTLGSASEAILNPYLKSDVYSLAFEAHFNDISANCSANYVSIAASDDTNSDKAIKIANGVVSAIGMGHVEYKGESNLSSYSHLRSFSYLNSIPIPLYYLETVFMCNKTEFYAYLDNSDAVAENIAKALMESAPAAIGTSSQTSSSSSASNSKSSNGTNFTDLYPNLSSVLNIALGSQSGCQTIFIDSSGNKTALADFLDQLFDLIRYLTVAIVIILSTMDYIKAITNHDDKALKNATNRAIRRCIIGLIIFFLPYLLKILFQLFGLYNLDTCGIGGGDA